MQYLGLVLLFLSSGCQVHLVAGDESLQRLRAVVPTSNVANDVTDLSTITEPQDGISILGSESTPIDMLSVASDQQAIHTVPAPGTGQKVYVNGKTGPWEIPSDPMAYIWWFIILYMFCLMSVVCDDYLVPTIDVIVEKLQIPEDVAGATLLAFACNGPELLTNVSAIFITESHVGMGCIVGSAIFNVLVIVGACPIFAPGGELYLPKQTFIRDTIFSAISIFILLWALPDIDLLHASVLLGMAFVYAFVVYKTKSWFGSYENDERIGSKASVLSGLSDVSQDVCASKLKDPLLAPDQKCNDEIPQEFRNNEAKEGQTFGKQMSNQSQQSHKSERARRSHSKESHKSLYSNFHMRMASKESCVAKIRHRMASKEKPLPEDPPVKRTMKTLWNWFSWGIWAPAQYGMEWTVPDVRKEEKEHLYMVSFVTAMIWLSTSAFVVVASAAYIKDFWGIPQSFLGLTLISVGTSWPNLIASVVTAEQGRGPIAISNALGSNVQNVFLVLALPLWFYCLLVGPYHMGSADITSSVVWMAGTLGVVVFLTVWNKFKLVKSSGQALFVLYFVYLVYACRHLFGF